MLLRIAEIADELITIFTSFEQLLNAPEPTVVTEAGKLIEVKLEQFIKAEKPMLVTEVDIVTDANEVHPLNALEPMVVTEFGIVTDDIAVLLWKALDAMLVTLYVAPFTTKLDNNVTLPEADALVPTLAATVPTV